MTVPLGQCRNNHDSAVMTPDRAVITDDRAVITHDRAVIIPDSAVNNDTHTDTHLCVHACIRAQKQNANIQTNKYASLLDSWRWVINDQTFNTTNIPKQLKEEWSVTSPTKKKPFLQMSIWHYVTYDVARIYYEATNRHGRIRSKEVMIRKPYIKPENCRRSDVRRLDVTAPSGVVMSCDNYDESYPDMLHSWCYYNVQSCDRYQEVTCVQVEGISGRILLAEKGKRLVLKHANQNDTGCYVCQSKNILERTICLSLTYLHVTSDDGEIISPPSLIHRHPVDNPVQVALNSTIHLECVYQTHPLAPVLWYHNNSILLHNDLRHNMSAGGALLDIVRVEFSDEGSYHCKVKQYGRIYDDGRYFRIHVNVPVKINGFESKTGFVGDNITLFCDITTSRVISYFKNVDMEITASDKYRITDDGRQLTIVNATSSDTATYTCNATDRYHSEKADARVIVLEPPVISDIRITDVTKRKHDVTVYQLYCRYKTDANLMINITWSLDTNACSNSAIIETMEDSPHLVNVAVNWVTASQSECTIRCSVQSGLRLSCHEITLGQSVDFVNESPCQFSSTTVAAPEPDDKRSGGEPIINEVKLASDEHATWVSENIHMVVSLSTACGIFILTSGIITVCYHRRRKRSNNSNISFIVEYRTKRGPALHRVVNSSHYAFNTLSDNLMNDLKEVEFPRRNLSLGEIIGQGQFGRVYKGTLTGMRQSHYPKKMNVAIKTLKYKAVEGEMVAMFLREAVMMKGFNHRHVLSLIGVTFDTDGSPLVVLPYMDNGDLRTYISNPDKVFRVVELLKMGQQVAEGMDYLSKLKFVHRDLAARNCMVDKQGTVKVADFGLSRDIYHQEYYRIEEDLSPLPVRWMAPESLQERIFTTKSDVWSFGILLWELVTRGSTPYPGIENWAVISHIKQQLLMEQPLFCPSSVYALMVDCWHPIPKLRPSFESLAETLDEIISAALTSDPSSPSARHDRCNNALTMGIKFTNVTRLRTDSASEQLSLLAEI